MGVTQVDDMDVITQTGAVGCIVVVTEYRHLRALALGHLQDNGDEMRFRLVALAELSPSMPSSTIVI